MRICLAALILIASGANAAAQHGSTTARNPFNTPEDRLAGAQIFQRTCAACHGPGGTGGVAGPDLVSAASRKVDSDEAVYQTIVKGIAGTSMPAFPGSAKEVWQLVAYVRSLSIGKGASRAKGDAGSGGKLFTANGCLNCHALGSRGGVDGPDLTEIGSFRSLRELERSLTHPNEEVSSDYWRLRARTRSGESISGIRMNEDTFSIQYRDAKGLRAVMKSELAEYEVVTTSPMPSYGDKLSEAQLNDIVAFLASQTQGGSR